MFRILCLALCLFAGAASAGTLRVFAAASLKTALDRAAQTWTRETGETVLTVYAGSSALARQIEAGAPADLFIPASADWMDRLEAEGLIRAESRVDLLGNSLVLVSHDAAPDDIAAAVATAPHIAMALVDAVPAGIYGKAALTALGLWETAAPKVVQADNVRAALHLVASGEAPVGIVYATDARAEPRVVVIATFPAESHPPIVYPAAALSEGQAQAFLDWLAGEEAWAIFAAAGFVRP